MTNPLKLWPLLCLFLFSGCWFDGKDKPEGVMPVQNFDVHSYLGQWYEIARLPHSFEEGLDHVTADYSIKQDGSIKVVNRGLNLEKCEWEEAEGKAEFVESPDIGHLKVSFFGPFYGAYIIFHLEDDVALISGPDTSYFWLLARTPTIDEARVQELVAKAQEKGFDTSQLIYPKQGDVKC